MKFTFLDVYRRLFSAAAPGRRRTFVWLCIQAVILGLVEMGVVGTVSLLGIAMASPRSLEAFPLYNQAVAASAVLLANIPLAMRPLILVMALVCLATLAKNIFLGFFSWRQALFSNRLSWDIFTSLYASYLRAPYEWHARQNSAELQLHLSWKNYVSDFIGFSVLAFSQIVICSILLITSLILAQITAAIAFVILALLAVTTYKYFKAKAKSAGELIAAYDEKLSRDTLGSLHGIREVRVYGIGRQCLAAATGNRNAYESKASLRNILGSIPQWFIECVGMFMMLGLLVALALSGKGEARAVGIFTLMAGVFWRLLPAVNKLLGSLLTLRAYLPYTMTVLNRLDTCPSGPALIDPKFVDFGAAVEMRHISFAYPQSRTILHDVSLHLGKGKRIGIVGLSGAGKSTLINILIGLLRPTKGDITADGRPLADDEALRTGYVPQSIYLMDTTLAENIAFSAWGQPVDHARLESCCKLAALDFIPLLQHGIDTKIGERGAQLSGGQIQRVGIARALYGKPQLLIFDEATSALDGAKETIIQQTINNLPDNITVIVIAHRLSTIESCDYTYWLHDGRIECEGTTRDVIAKYSEHLFRIQNSNAK